MLNPKQQNIDIGNMNINELKSTAFDIREQIDSLTNGLARIKMMIAEKTKELNNKALSTELKDSNNKEE